MKIWIDEVRPAPNGYVWVKSVNDAKRKICAEEMIYANHWMDHVSNTDIIPIIDMDYSAGDYASNGGDYIELLNWFEETGRDYPIRIHSMDPSGIENMRRIIQRNGWKEIF